MITECYELSALKWIDLHVYCMNIFKVIEHKLISLCYQYLKLWIGKSVEISISLGILRYQLSYHIQPHTTEKTHSTRNDGFLVSPSMHSLNLWHAIKLKNLKFVNGLNLSVLSKIGWVCAQTYMYIQLYIRMQIE